jgi:hypothetical protein
MRLYDADSRRQFAHYIMNTNWRLPGRLHVQIVDRADSPATITNTQGAHHLVTLMMYVVNFHSIRHPLEN